MCDEEQGINFELVSLEAITMNLYMNLRHNDVCCFYPKINADNKVFVSHLYFEFDVNSIVISSVKWINVEAFRLSLCIIVNHSNVHTYMNGSSSHTIYFLAFEYY